MTLKLGTPASWSVGMFGIDFERTGSDTPSAMTWPLSSIGMTAAVSDSPNGTSPAAIAPAISEPPR
jgi:hypothetical protein